MEVKKKTWWKRPVRKGLSIFQRGVEGHDVEVAVAFSISLDLSFYSSRIIYWIEEKSGFFLKKRLSAGASVATETWTAAVCDLFPLKKKKQNRNERSFFNYDFFFILNHSLKLYIEQCCYTRIKKFECKINNIIKNYLILLLNLT